MSTLLMVCKNRIDNLGLTFDRCEFLDIHLSGPVNGESHSLQNFITWIVFLLTWQFLDQLTNLCHNSLNPTSFNDHTRYIRRYRIYIINFFTTWFNFNYFIMTLKPVITGFVFGVFNVRLNYSFFFHPRLNGQWRPTSKNFYPRFYPLLLFTYLNSQKEPVFPFLMFSAKQGNCWYHFYKVFGMFWSLTGNWTRDLPHLKPALYH